MAAEQLVATHIVDPLAAIARQGLKLPGISDSSSTVGYLKHKGGYRPLRYLDPDAGFEDPNPGARGAPQASLRTPSESRKSSP